MFYRPLEGRVQQRRALDKEARERNEGSQPEARVRHGKHCRESVFPGEAGSVCGTLGLRAEGSTRSDNRFRDFLKKDGNAVTENCIGYREARDMVTRDLEQHGFRGWTVVRPESAAGVEASRGVPWPSSRSACSATRCCARPRSPSPTSTRTYSVVTRRPSSNAPTCWARAWAWSRGLRRARK